MSDKKLSCTFSFRGKEYTIEALDIQSFIGFRWFDIERAIGEKGLKDVNLYDYRSHRAKERNFTLDGNGDPLMVIAKHIQDTLEAAVNFVPEKEQDVDLESDWFEDE